MDTTKTDGIFLNGKAQVIEMLKYMEFDERENLLKQLRRQGRQLLADELMMSSLGLEQISLLKDQELKYLFYQVSAPILGIAIRSLDISLQRRVLSLAPRSYAEETYKFMTADIDNEEDKIQKAQDKTRKILVQMIEKKQL